MPCADGGPTYEQTQEPKRLRAALCAILTLAEYEFGLDRVLNKVNWEEAGITKEWVLGWWAEHKAEDEKRRKYEAERAAQAAKRAEAIAKLTPAERAALGVRE